MHSLENAPLHPFFCQHTSAVSRMQPAERRLSRRRGGLAALHRRLSRRGLAQSGETKHRLGYATPSV